MKYRPEIDGLRAIAVIPVILFHAGLDLFSGGFVGVDIFFVISGYLITSIIIDDIEKDRFSIVNFYERRARRILPALIVVLTFTYATSYFSYLPAPHKVVGQYVVASIFSASNLLLFFKGNDYFGLEQGLNPLFHTWSLGVEEQFYIVFPMFLVLIWKLGESRVFWVTLTIALASFVFSEWAWRNNPIANFYLPISRAWELLAGSLTAILSRRLEVKPNNLLSALGLTAIIFSIFFYDERTPFPSFYALTPILGSVLLVLFSGRGTIVSKLLSTKLLVGIGLVSYSAYLWHLPLQLYITYFFGQGAVQLGSYLFLLSIFSFVTYRLVETTFRRKIPKPHFITSISLASAILVLFGTIGHINEGFPSRKDIFNNLQNNNGWGLACNGNVEVSDKCSNSKSPKVAILGNSYSMVWVNALSEEFDLVQLTQDSCAIGFVDKVADINGTPCPDFYRGALSTIENTETIETIVMSSPFDRELGSPEYINSFLDLIQMLDSKNVVVIGPTPQAPFKVGECVLKSMDSHAEACDFGVPETHKAKVNRLANLLSQNTSAKFIDITDAICPQDVCRMKIGSDDAMYIDTGHLSRSGSKIVFNNISNLFEGALNKRHNQDTQRHF